MITDVVAGLVKKDGKFLIAKRIWGNETSVNKFEFPGGKVEAGEDFLHAIERELREEMCIEVKGVSELLNYTHDIPGRTINLHLILCDYLDGEIKLTDHSEIKWVDRYDILENELCPGDEHIAKELINKNII